MKRIIVCQNPDCPRYRKEMRYTGDELDVAWKFWCPDYGVKPSGCGNYRLVTKDKVGGTMGAGRPGKGDQRRPNQVGWTG